MAPTNHAFERLANGTVAKLLQNPQLLGGKFLHLYCMSYKQQEDKTGKKEMVFGFKNISIVFTINLNVYNNVGDNFLKCGVLTNTFCFSS